MRARLAGRRVYRPVTKTQTVGQGARAPVASRPRAWRGRASSRVQSTSDIPGARYISETEDRAGGAAVASAPGSAS
jgi:hypothetical protein